MQKLIILARIPRDSNVLFVNPNLDQALEDLPRADLNILTLRADKIDMQKIRAQLSVFETSTLYTLDSGLENALA